MFFVCEKIGNVHGKKDPITFSNRNIKIVISIFLLELVVAVCDDTCKEVLMDPTDDLLVCTVSGRCFDRLLSPDETEPDPEQQQGGATDEAEPFMGSGRFACAYLLGCNCEDEKELEAVSRFC